MHCKYHIHCMGSDVACTISGAESTAHLALFVNVKVADFHSVGRFFLVCESTANHLDAVHQWGEPWFAVDSQTRKNLPTE